MQIDTLTFLLAFIAIVVVAFVFWLMRGNRLRKFDLNVLKGLLHFTGTAEPEVEPESVNLVKQNRATEVLRWVQQKLNKVEGDYVLNDTTNDNAKTAAQLYSKLEGEIIGTCFFESPDYGAGDYAKVISPGVKFHRLTIRDVCSEQTRDIVERRFSKLDCSASLTVIDDYITISRMDGIFCRLPDKSCLAFVAMDNFGKTGTNKGLVFSGSLAEHLFLYYKSFVS